MVTFTTELLTLGNNVGIEVPEDIVLGFGVGKRVPVIVTIEGYSYPSTTAVMGGKYLLPLAKEHREEIGVAGGEIHEVTLTHDTSNRETPVPDFLAEALAAAGVRAAFDALAPSKRKEHVRQVTSAKAEETRDRRIKKIVDSLS
ncbi:YdeI/OmpD-associated family protein [Brevibacterium sp. CFH 10365]|uniref:YdeI/OmpD-associated family protein n=1 Tax=Brevibacterium sp. CFH 10365 TaxID=2585207 RepID=UPI00126680F6|nr:YdeI/OmpD-associated family protein [Brevibacterium sp. CFH 10365]